MRRIRIKSMLPTDVDYRRKALEHLMNSPKRWDEYTNEEKDQVIRAIAVTLGLAIPR